MIEFKIQRLLGLVSRVLILGLCVVSIAVGWIPNVSVAALSRTSASTAPSGAIDPEEMEAFVDSFFEAKMAELHIPGAAIVLVRDGQVLLSKGYGYADLARQIPVDPARTAFRAGSVSKLFTWTAVMQVVERGLLDLDADVNRYLTDLGPRYLPTTGDAGTPADPYRRVRGPVDRDRDTRS